MKASALPGELRQDAHRRPGSAPRTVEGKRKKGGVGAGGAGKKLLGPYLVFPRPSRNAFLLAFCRAPNGPEISKNYPAAFS
jgi:hypothetical protein